ncbi:MAG: ligA [Chlamydiia bacterium]|nr:ligA [Chlamydiia bacterium]
MVTRQDYEKLCDEVWKHNRLYFQEGKPIISDDEYDRLVRKLEAVEETHPEWISATSPTQRVGEKPLAGFLDVSHKKPMLSLEKGFTKEELEDFDARVKRILSVKQVEYTVEVKMDGLAISVLYEKGQYKQAITRGDGKVGSDVTQNLKTLHGLPLRLTQENIPDTLEIRGEVFLPKQGFEKMNEERAKLGEPLWANPRNAAAGSLKLLDPKEVAKRVELSVTFYGVVYEPALPIRKQSEVNEYLKSLGLSTLPYHKLCHSIDEVMEYAAEIEKKRVDLPFGIDGIVLKVDDLRAYEDLGTTGKHPRGAIAYKFAAEQAWTTIKDITVQVGRTGVLTPVAELEPVLLAGSTIARATLHNFDELARKDIRVGDYVAVEKGGDVIPKVLQADPSRRNESSKPFHIPKTCPACQSTVYKDPQEVAYRCVNPVCPEQVLRGLTHFVSKDGLDIENLGEKVMEQLFLKGFVKYPSDIFSLTREQLAQLDNFKEKSINNLLESIEKAKKTTLARLIMALGIRHVGIQAADLIANHTGSIEKLLQISKEELLELQGVGEKVASSFVEYFANRENQKQMQLFQERGLECTSEDFTAFQGHPFYNKLLVLTGTLHSLSRHEAERKIKAVGGKVSDSVGKKTDFVVVGTDAGSKFEKAKKLGIPVLTEDEFLQRYSAHHVTTA